MSHVMLIVEPGLSVPQRDGTSFRRLDHDDFALALSEAGLEVTVLRGGPNNAPANRLVLLHMASGLDDIGALPFELRERTVAIGGRVRGEPDDPAAWVRQFRLLGLILYDAWRNWTYHARSALGLYGRNDVAEAAGLVPLSGTGALNTQPSPLGLPEVVARYLLAAQNIVLK